MTMNERTSIRLGLSFFTIQAVGSTAILPASKVSVSGENAYSVRSTRLGSSLPFLPGLPNTP